MRGEMYTEKSSEKLQHEAYLAEEKRWRIRNYLLLVLAGTLINLAGVRVALGLRLPVFLDSIGTILASVLGGYMPGVTVGLYTNLINGASDFTTLYYGVLNVLIAISAAFLSERGCFGSLKKLPVPICVFALIGGGIGSVLTWFLYGADVGTGISSSLTWEIWQGTGLAAFWSQLTADMLIDLLDKTVSTVIIFVILRLLPERLCERLYFNAWMQAPLSGQRRRSLQKEPVRILSLRTRVLIVVALTTLLTAVTVAGISYFLFHRMITTEMTLEKEVVAQMEWKFLTRTVSLFLGFFFLIMSVVVWLAEYNILIPLNSMARAAEEFAYDTEMARDDSARKLNELQIQTGDEIENLYRSLSKTAEDTRAYISETQKKNETIARMQNGMIMVLADLVESRDKCTGDHVRHTALYVQIILEQMRKDGSYTDQLTDEFIFDVISSAPLHDVGKIRTPDAILNKPGRLTDEEYEVMKKHAPEGGRIIDRAVDAVSGETSEYLEEARNVTVSHHEKWDGTGYPEGLSGENIPLSARIMAVADVFDALVSHRSYKEAWSFDEATEMIRLGSGTHFDPKVVEAFLKAKEQIRAVWQEPAVFGQDTENEL